MCACVMCVSVQRSQKVVLDPSEQEFKLVLNHLMWMLGTELGSSAKGFSAKPISESSSSESSIQSLNKYLK